MIVENAGQLEPWSCCVKQGLRKGDELLDLYRANASNGAYVRLYGFLLPDNPTLIQQLNAVTLVEHWSRDLIAQQISKQTTKNKQTTNDNNKQQYTTFRKIRCDLTADHAIGGC